MTERGRPILITGANGLLGQYLVKVLIEEGQFLVATGRGVCRFLHAEVFKGTPQQAPSYIYADMDFTDPASIRHVMDYWKPSVVIHAGAMTQVDPCEEDPLKCYQVNVEGTDLLLDAAKAVGARFVFVSTDFVFDGAAGPYKEDDTPAPISVYGQSKWEAEKLVMRSGLDWAIVRTILVYGTPFSGTRANIISWARDSLQAGRTIKVVSDQWRTPTYVGDLAEGISALLRLQKQGVYHISGRDFLTPYDMTLRTARLLGLDEALLVKVDASTFFQPGRRPPRTGFIIDKARRELGFEPVSFDEGILLTLGLTER
ncbi:SDR family oxidoreductase [Dinghuibacter silviterrae]|uniref:dTDP-4-dehydrorhamnose reductase n=1 Tax=Dinghuibacter silviterrae TaxID=1539049 RepID=A0A4R8DH32_9BACT|nr:SDR family oxidoreductase [Dinghuibacter silviterrae]TDW97009.1 dTDP-4-dehydrorhamnose reductase [Dinghuibacter silviterrae]